MRLTIIPSDGSIYVDCRGYTNLDLTWIPEIDGKKVHAVQWEDGQGEVEFVCAGAEVTGSNRGLCGLR